MMFQIINNTQAEIEAATIELKEHTRRLPTLRGMERGLGHRDKSIMTK